MKTEKQKKTCVLKCKVRAFIAWPILWFANVVAAPAAGNLEEEASGSGYGRFSLRYYAWVLLTLALRKDYISLAMLFGLVIFFAEWRLSYTAICSLIATPAKSIVISPHSVTLLSEV